MNNENSDSEMKINKKLPHAKAMDLPDYPCPPNVAGLEKYVGSWGYFLLNTNISQDEQGFLWVRGDIHCSPTATFSRSGLGAWTEEGISVYLPREHYELIDSMPRESLERSHFVRVASLLKEIPQYVKDYAQGSR